MFFNSKFLAALLALAIPCLSSSIVAKPSSLNFIQCPWEHDARQWKPFNYSIQAHNGIVLYLPDGDRADGWLEMVSTQWQEDVQLSPADYFTGFVQGLCNMYPNGQVLTTTLDQSNASLTAEWWTEGKLTPLRYGMVKIFTNGPHVYLMSYVTCDRTKIASSRQVWLPMLHQAQLDYSVL